MVGKRGQQVQVVGGAGFAHRAAELLAEGGEIGFGGRVQGLFDEVRRGREVGEPDIVVVETGEVGFGDSPRGAAHRAQTDSFVGMAGRAELDDANGHGMIEARESAIHGCHSAMPSFYGTIM